MFIGRSASRRALRQEGHVDLERLAFTVDMTLLTEGGIVSLGVYKHLPPDGGKMSKLNRPPSDGNVQLRSQ